jgi:hypothetical protein
MLGDWSLSFNPGSLEELTRMAGMAALLDPEITAALTRGAEMVVTTAQANTWDVFDNPTGTLASRIYAYVKSPSEVAVGVRDIPYAHRREYSFYGPDSLGRVYPNDIPRPYLEPALEEDTPLIADLVELACYNAMGRLVVAGA